MLLAGLFLMSAASRGVALELPQCQELFLSGKYEDCAHATQEAIAGGRYGEAWPVLKAQSQMVLGQYDAALLTIESALQRYSWSLRLRWLGRDAALRAGQAELAAIRLTEMIDLAARFPWRYTDPEEIVVMGQLDLMQNVDARDVLQKRFEVARQRSPRTREAWLAIGELAIDKHDAALAAETFRAGLKLHPNDPDLHFGLARALEDSNGAESAAEVEAALKLNDRHIPSLLWFLDGHVDAERYPEAETVLAKILQINPQQPDAWAYRAVLAHLTGDWLGEILARDKALARWPANPEVDHLIGRKLSQHYRHREGAVYQRRALAADPGFVPAQRQLARDLLRLGDEDEGWQQAKLAHEKDGYNVDTFNLLELHDELKKFATLEDPHFLLRMEAREAQLYGTEVLAVLNRAREALTQRYGLVLKHRVTVEVFPDENDFAVRTFGMPGVSGYLGVCFGRVITANSPASHRDTPSNWQSVLWHEFCHVVTLELTGNRIPRWLSEGISVFEERRASPAWGQRMNPRYREAILAGNMTPLSDLSSAFMRPPSGWHLQFAYYQSSLAVEFLVTTYGEQSMRKVLRDLQAGLPINSALDRNCDSLPKLEQDFATFAKQQAESLAPGADFEKPNLEVLLNEDNDALAVWVNEHPDNLPALVKLADQQIAAEQWSSAEKTLRQIIALYPRDTSGGNAHEKLASAYQALNRPRDEATILSEFLNFNGDAVAAGLRLMELARQSQDWPGLARASRHVLAIDPLLRQGHEGAALAAEKLGQPAEAVVSLQRVALLEPDDIADVHYRLARTLLQSGDKERAKRHVLMALEEAPRFRAAQQLLLELRETTAAPSSVKISQ